MTRKQNLKQAIARAAQGGNDLSRAANALIGLPQGGWGETEQAMRQIADLLPMRDARAYTISEFVTSAYSVDHAMRYRSRL